MKKLIIFLLCCGMCFAQKPNLARMLSGVNAQTGTSYTFLQTDVTQVVSFNNALPVAVTLPNPTTPGSGFSAGTIFTTQNLGAGTVTITCSGCTINLAASLPLLTGQGADIYSDGTNYTALATGSGGGPGAVISVTAGAGLFSPATTGAVTLRLQDCPINYQQLSGGPGTWNCAPQAGSPGAPANSIQFNLAGGFSGDSFFSYNAGTHTQTVQNQSITGTQTFAGPYTLDSIIPGSPPVVGAAGHSGIAANSDGSYCMWVNGGPCNDLTTGTGLNVSLAPLANQSVAQPSAGGSASGTSLNVNVFENARYADQFVFTQSPSSPATIAIGANVVTINAVRGISALSVLAYARHWLWIAGTGTPERVMLTATTCIGASTGTCTITFTAVNTHSAGYSIATATAGYQEALDDALSNTSTNPVSGVTILGSPTTNQTASSFVTFNAPFTIYDVDPGSQAPYLIDFMGATISCNTPALDCIKVGTHANQQFPSDTTIQGFQIVAATGMGRTADGTTVAIHDAAINTKILRGGFGFINSNDVFDTLIKVDNDQHSVITQIELNNGNGPPMKCDSTWCGSAILGTSLSNGATGDISHSDLSMACTGNPIDWQSGNTLHVSDVIIQAYNQFGIRSKAQFGPNPAVDIDNGYWEIGSCTNPLGIGVAGLISQGWAKISASIGPVGKSQLFTNSGTTGATQYNYFIVTKSSTGSTVSVPMIAGYTNSNQTAGNVTVKWWKIGSTGTITYDVIRTSGTTITPVTTAACVGGTKTVCGSRATGLTVGGNCVGSICSFTDDPSANTVAYAVAIPTFYPLLDFWPDSIVLAGLSDGSGSTNATTPTVHLDRIGTGILQSTPPMGVTNQYGNTAPSVFATKCDSTGWSPVWFQCQTGDPTVAVNFGMLLEVGAANSNTADSGNKGRLNFEQGLKSSISGTELITFADSNATGTLNDSHHRPAWDANDTYCGLDNAGGAAASAAQLACGAPVSQSWYIGSVPDNVNWLARITASLFTFKLPVTTNSQITSTLASGTPPFVIASQTRVPNLKTGGNPLVVDCGTTATCAATTLLNSFVVKGSVALTAGSASMTALPFTNTLWICTTNDVTTSANPSKLVQTGNTTGTVTGTGTDVINFICAGN